MNLKVNGMRRAALCAGLWAAALLVSCGGGAQVSRFVPTRVLAFGDESSVINSDGSKYTVNALLTNSSALDCQSNPLWIQYVATSAYGLVFPECNPNGLPAPASRIYAQPSAQAADISSQIDLHLSNDSFSGTDLVLVLAGANDVITQYQQYPGASEAQLTTNLQQAGTTLALQVNRIAGLGGKVIISTVPDMGLTPYAIIQENIEGGRAALLTRLTAAFNNALRATILNDGREIGLVLADELVQVYVRNVGNTFINVTLPACASPLPGCTTATLVTDPATGQPATATTWLWADDLHLSAGGQSVLGSTAATRAAGNPF